MGMDRYLESQYQAQVNYAPLVSALETIIEKWERRSARLMKESRSDLLTEHEKMELVIAASSIDKCKDELQKLVKRKY